MSRKVGDTFYIEAETPQECFRCHKLVETRPAGLNDEQLCFNCVTQVELTYYEKKFLSGIKKVAYTPTGTIMEIPQKTKEELQ